MVKMILECPRCGHHRYFCVYELSVQEFHIGYRLGRWERRSVSYRPYEKILHIKCLHCFYDTVPECFGLIRGIESYLLKEPLSLVPGSSCTFESSRSCSFELKRNFFPEEDGEREAVEKLLFIAAAVGSDIEQLPQYLVDKHSAVRRAANQRLSELRKSISTARLIAIDRQIYRVEHPERNCGHLSSGASRIVQILKKLTSWRVIYAIGLLLERLEKK